MKRRLSFTGHFGSEISFSLAVIFIIRLFSTSAFRVPTTKRQILSFCLKLCLLLNKVFALNKLVSLRGSEGTMLHEKFVETGSDFVFSDMKHNIFLKQESNSKTNPDDVFELWLV